MCIKTDYETTYKIFIGEKMKNIEKIVDEYFHPEESKSKGKLGIRLFESDPKGFNCPNNVLLYAPNEFYKLSDNAIEEATGGCGPGGIGDRLVPDTAWGLNIKRACRIHDFMYSDLCNDSKEDADRVFLNNMRRLIIHGSKIKFLISPRLKRAKTYYLVVKHCGGSSVSKNKQD